MKNLLSITTLAFLASCADTAPMPKGSGMEAAIEASDGNRGDVPSVNHPNYNPNPYGYGYGQPGYGNPGYGGWGW